MATLTLFTDDYGAKKCLAPELGDISSWGNTNPVSSGLLSSINALSYRTILDNEVYRLTNLITIPYTTSNIYLYTNPQKTSAVRLSNYNTTINKFRNVEIYNNNAQRGLIVTYYSDGHDRTVYVCLATAIINNTFHFGLLAAGFNSQGRSCASFMWNSTTDAMWNSAVKTFDPYSGAGTSDEGGGDNSNFSEDSDSVTSDALPTISAVGSGFSTLFTPTKAQLRTLGDTLWGNTIVGFFQNAITNIKELFVSLGILPFVAPAGATVNVTWMDIATINIPLTLANQQFVEVDMGSINLATNKNIFTYDSVLDYSPYSKLGIYLPFIGYQELDIDECRGAVIGLRYRIDILSGSCVAIISISGNDIYQFSGNCLTQIPLTSADFTGLISSSVQVAVAAASMGASAAVASAGDAVTAEMAASEKITGAQGELQNAQHAASVSNSKGSLASATANGMMGMKPNYKKTGAVSASTSLLNVKQPYLFLTTPRQSYPANYGHYCGFPCNITDTLGNFSGYTVVEDIRLNGLVATSSEVEEIYNLLKSGVII